MALILDHLINIGQLRAIPTDPDERKMLVSRWHQVLCEENTAWPTHADHPALYHAFFKAIRNGDVKLDRYSLLDHVHAFKKWATTSDVLQRHTNTPPNQFALADGEIWKRERDALPDTERLARLKDNLSLCKAQQFHAQPETSPKRQAYEDFKREYHELCAKLNLELDESDES